MPAKQRKDFMTEDQWVALRGMKRTHQNCREKTGVARPGKTAHDRYKRNKRD